MTPKQGRFVDEYMIDLNATQAAIRAGYSEEPAGQYAVELLKKPDVAAAIAERQAAVAKRTEYTQDQVLRELVDIATEAREAAQYGPAVKAWELVGRHVGMWPQRPVEVNATFTLEVQQRVMEWRRVSVEDALQAARELAPGLLDDTED